MSARQRAPGWHAGSVLELLTGAGLAASAGLNAYLPLLAIGLLARYTSVITLPSSWQWMANGWVVAILAVLLAIEVVAYKIPVVDTVNDTLQTVVRPTAGGLAFGAGTSATTVTVSDPSGFFAGHQWLPIVLGVGISFVVHVGKALARPVINTFTLGVGAPIVSTVEDVTSAVLSVVAIVIPFLVIGFLAAFVLAFWALLRRRARRRAQRRAAAAYEQYGPPPYGYQRPGA